MKNGIKNKYEGMVQRKLGINDDNIFGEKTLAAVKEFKEEE
ncbi:hypothetical protein V7178_20650 [Gottfriedia acidiceleris]